MKVHDIYQSGPFDVDIADLKEGVVYMTHGEYLYILVRKVETELFLEDLHAETGFCAMQRVGCAKEIGLKIRSDILRTVLGQPRLIAGVVIKVHGRKEEFRFS